MTGFSDIYVIYNSSFSFQKWRDSR